jgi:GTP:adenosylcobinamide-phosphate guanylyltransferase
MVDVLVLAGAPNSGKLAECSESLYEAFIEINGRPMLEYVLNALSSSRYVDRICVVGPKEEIEARFNGRYLDLNICEMGDSLIENLVIGLKTLGGNRNVLICTSDIPLLTAEAVDDFIENCQAEDIDVFYSVVSKDDIDKAYPGVHRTYVQVKEGVFTGGNVAMLAPSVVQTYEDMLKKAIDLRKNPLGLARLLGFGCIMKFLTKSLSIVDIEKRVEEMLSLRGKAVLSTYPEIGIDVDKPEDVELMNRVIK